MLKNEIYLDNNATTMMPKSVINEMEKWFNKTNPSGDDISSKKSNEMINMFKYKIAKLGEFKLAVCDNVNTSNDEADAEDNEYFVIITSCASESNATIIKSLSDSYGLKTGEKPHIITSAYEHKSIDEAVNLLLEQNKIELTKLKPVHGFITPESVKRAIKSNTCLISIIHGNNETGAINDIAAIGRVAREACIPLHSDTVQTYGKYVIKPNEFDLDAMSVSAHKWYGSPGLGLLIIRRKLVDAYEMCSLIPGSQNSGLRGGTYNLPAIGAASAAFDYNFGITKTMLKLPGKFTTNRKEKNKNLLILKKYMIKMLKSKCPYQTLDEHRLKNIIKPVKLIQITPDDSNSLPNTLFIAIEFHKKTIDGKLTKVAVCNKKIKEYLGSFGIIIGTGSACNSTSRNSSHVLDAILLDPDENNLTKSVIRISLSDITSKKQIDIFVDTFIKILTYIYDKKLS